MSENRGKDDSSSQVIPVHGERGQSSSSSDSDSSDDEGQDIKILNNRMIGCMDKVFGL